MSGTTPCQAKNCPNGKPASKLECPTCNKLGIRGSFFCGQECFKADWVSLHVQSILATLIQPQKSHKVIHDLVKGTITQKWPDGTFNPWPTHKYHGSLRPRHPLSPKREVPVHIRRPDYADHEEGVPLSEVKADRYMYPPKILNKEEQEKMRAVCKIGREVLDAVAAEIKPGVTTDYLDEVTHRECIQRGAYPSPLNYRNFPKSVCTSINEVVCHGIPDQRPLEEGDIINIDVSVYKDGFHGDLNETYPVGKVDADSIRLMKAARDSMYAGIEICKPGALWRDIGKAIQPVAEAAGCAVVRHYTGHGINDLFHPAPNIPHYAKNKTPGQMKPGMCFTIEPMLNLGTRHELDHWPDDWTASTLDGQRSAQFEETMLITEDGVEILTKGQPRLDLQ